MAEKQEQHEKARAASARAVKAGAEASKDIGDLARETGEAGIATARRGVEAGAETAREAMTAAEGMARQQMGAAAQGSRQFFDLATRQMSDTYRQIADQAQETAATLQSLLSARSATGTAVNDLQGAFVDTFGRLAEAQWRMSQDLFTRLNPLHAIEAQQRAMRDCTRSMLEGSTEMLRAAQRVTEEVLEPLERLAASRQRPGADEGKVADVMTASVELASPEESVHDAARRMAQSDTGALPVGENDRLVGMITDRDITVRVTAENKNPRETRVREVMSRDIRYVFDDEGLGEAAQSMAQQQVRRLPVLNRQKRLVGIVSIGDLAQHRLQIGGEALRGVARPGTQHNQSAAFHGSKPTG